MIGADRLFVPLTAEAFGWWRSGKKRWDVRRHAPRWAWCVWLGRRVELRRGYSEPSLWGSIGRTESDQGEVVAFEVLLDHAKAGAEAWP